MLPVGDESESGRIASRAGTVSRTSPSSLECHPFGALAAAAVNELRTLPPPCRRIFRRQCGGTGRGALKPRTPEALVIIRNVPGNVCQPEQPCQAFFHHGAGSGNCVCGRTFLPEIVMLGRGGCTSGGAQVSVNTQGPLAIPGEGRGLRQKRRRRLPQVHSAPLRAKTSIQRRLIRRMDGDWKLRFGRLGERSGSGRAGLNETLVSRFERTPSVRTASASAGLRTPY